MKLTDYDRKGRDLTENKIVTGRTFTKAHTRRKSQARAILRWLRDQCREGEVKSLDHYLKEEGTNGTRLNQVLALPAVRKLCEEVIGGTAVVGLKTIHDVLLARIEKEAENPTMKVSEIIAVADFLAKMNGGSYKRSVVGAEGGGALTQINITMPVADHDGERKTVIDVAHKELGSLVE